MDTYDFMPKNKNINKQYNELSKLTKTRLFSVDYTWDL